MTTSTGSRVDVELDDDDIHELSAEQERDPSVPGLSIYLFVGVVFGVVLTKGEAISWFRIQEMFRFQGFHMFGIFATALPTAIAGVQILKRRWRHTLGGAPIVVPPKHLGSGVRYAVGGTIFGLGWALTGACPGPLFALLGTAAHAHDAGETLARLGTWTYGRMRHRLPH